MKTYPKPRTTKTSETERAREEERFPLWEHVIQNPDVFAHVLSFLNATERKFVTHVSMETRQVMREKLRMGLVGVKRHRTIAQIKQLDSDAVKFERSGLARINPKMVDWKTYSPWLRLLKDASTVPDKFTIKECRGTGQLEMALEFCVLKPPEEMKGFVEDRCMNEEYFVENVVKTNEISLLRWATERKRLKWNARVTLVAAEQGNVQMLEYCVKNFARYLSSNKEVDIKKVNNYDRELSVVAQEGHLDCLRYLLEYCGGFEFKKTRIIRGPVWNQTEGEFIMHAAARSSHLHIVEYLLSKGSPVTSDTLLFCASEGSLECLKYLRENSIQKVDWDGAWGCVIASAGRGNLEMCKYCVYNGCPLEVPPTKPNAMRTAVDYGHLDIVRFLHEEGGLQFDELHIASALTTGNVEILKYVLLQQMIPLREDFFHGIWDLWTEVRDTLNEDFELELRRKRQTDHFLCVKFLYEEVQIPVSKDAYMRIYELALTWGDCALLKWVFDKIKNDFGKYDFPSNKDFVLPWPEPQHCEYAAGKGYLDCLQFLHETAMWRVCTHASEPMNMDTIRAALRNFQPECARYAFDLKAWVIPGVGENMKKGKNLKRQESDVRKLVERVETIVRNSTLAELDEFRAVPKRYPEKFNQKFNPEKFDFMGIGGYNQDFDLYSFDDEFTIPGVNDSDFSDSDDESYGSEDTSDDDDNDDDDGLSFSSSPSFTSDEWPNDHARAINRLLNRKLRASIEQQCLQINGELPTEGEMRKLLKQHRLQNPEIQTYIENLTRDLEALGPLNWREGPRSGNNNNNNGRGRGRGGRGRGGRGRGGRGQGGREGRGRH
jgi:hypothetical protein